VNCRGLIRELSSYLDRELTPQDVAEVERHLAACEDCRWIVDTTKKTIEFYCNSEPLPLPDDVRSRLHQALEARLKRPGR
jgi:anti-sigma factor RsiW